MIVRFYRITTHSDRSRRHKRFKIFIQTDSQRELGQEALVVALALGNWYRSSHLDAMTHEYKWVKWNSKGIVVSAGRCASPTTYPLLLTSTDCPKFQMNSSLAYTSIHNVRATGASHVSILVDIYQSSPNTTHIYENNLTPNREQLKGLIRQIKSYGMKVSLRPQIEFGEKRMTSMSVSSLQSGRGVIGVNFTREEQWKEWFGNYTHIMRQYASLCKRESVDLLVIGVGLSATVKRGEWNTLIETLRDELGPSTNLTYAAVSGLESQVPWWDKLDYIGVDGGFDMPDSVAERQAKWNYILYDRNDSLSKLHQQHDRQVLFTSLGYCSGNCPEGPEVNLTSQAQRYVSAFEATSDIPWLEGVFFSGWSADPTFGGLENYCTTPQWKPAEDVIGKWFGGARDTIDPDYASACPCVL
ncbi:hypothetical protein PROFUN_13805 [Planoprotostelium fungivorum]|uniref:Uncharacterized protein n=1 Tax=Planoprotostelium fungivorum TaxID=1890364 RepID=A0A2P6N2X0_9EUKA|nr:hypothetical protein PROFUN_13805 [Planoprotostelium fungivorum]